MGNTWKGVERVNGLLSDSKFSEISGLRLKLLKKKKGSIVLGSLSKENLISVIGTVKLQDFYEFEEIVRHIMSLDSTLNIEEDTACSICLDRFADTSLPCGHQYCFEDISCWGCKIQECPKCRVSFQTIKSFRRTSGPSQFKQSLWISKEKLLGLVHYT